MKNNDPAFLLYTSDFLTGTIFMTYEQTGKYIKLLCLQHQKGRLTKEEFFSICDEKDLRVSSCFSIAKNGLFYNKRLEIETEKRNNFVESRRSNGSKGGRPPKPSAKPSGYPTDNLPEDEDEDVIISKDRIEFKEFYLLYPLKKSKLAAEKKWKLLSPDNQSKCLEVLKSTGFKEWVSNQDPKYLKHPSTWINQGCWEDELIIKKSSPKSTVDLNNLEEYS
jgi:hypothetical protein